MISIVASKETVSRCEPFLRDFGQPYVQENVLFESQSSYDFAIVEFPREESLGRLWGARSQGLVFPILLLAEKSFASKLTNTQFVNDRILFTPFPGYQFYVLLQKLWKTRYCISDDDCDLFGQWFERPSTQLALIHERLDGLLNSLA